VADEEVEEEVEVDCWLSGVEFFWLVVVVVAARPWKAFEAIRASAPERATTPVAIQRVVVDIRRRPASRAITARRALGSGAVGPGFITPASLAPRGQLKLSGT
jgi:hypothetical protein